MTQFLTKAQNMPREIESALVSTIREFIWNSNAPMIRLRRFYAPKCEGGINLPDIPAQNKAIQLTSVNPHLGPIRFVYFYRCIYL